MERLKQMKETLMSCVQSQLANPSAADTKELGEAIDMIKDLSEAVYYCSVVKAMEETEKEKEYAHKYQQQSQPQYHYYTPYIKYIDPYLKGRDMDREMGRMYFDEYYYDGNGHGKMYYNGNGNGGNGSSNNGNMSYYDRGQYPKEVRDYREGKSPMTRRGYMEGKEMHKDKAVQMQELEKYMQELSHDITEMINDASPEEKTLLQQRLATLATKVK